MVNFLCSFAIHNIRKCEMRQRKNIDSYKSKDYNTNCLNTKIKIGE